MQLKHSGVRPPHRFASLAAGMLLLLAGATNAASAADSAEQGLYRIDMQVTANGVATSPLMLVKAGEPFSVAKGNGASTWRGDFVLDRVNERDFQLKSVIKQNNRVTGNPSLKIALGQPATISVKADPAADELRMQFTVTTVAAATP